MFTNAIPARRLSAWQCSVLAENERLRSIARFPRIVAEARNEERGTACPNCGMYLAPHGPLACGLCGWAATSADGIFKTASAAPTRPGFIDAARERAAKQNITIAEAMSQLARERPELHAAYLEAARENASLRRELRLLTVQTAAYKSCLAALSKN